MSTPRTPVRRHRPRYGVSGWDYADWKGPLFPDPTPRGYRGLPLLARFLDFMEVNVSYYRILPPDSTLRWLEETPDDFTFAFKAWRGWTHDDEDPRGESGDRFRALVEPSAAAGRLEGVLAQFPPGLSSPEEALDRLLPIRDGLAPHRIYAEFRHRALWRDDFFRRLEEEGIAFVNVDLPQVGNLPPLSRVNTGPAAYVRLHGRNRAGWSRGASRDDRYDHGYDVEEIEEISDAIRELLDRCPRVLVGANNHFKAQAPAAIALLRSALEGVTPAVPERLRNADPEVARRTTSLSPSDDEAVRREAAELLPGFDDEEERTARGTPDRS